MSGGPEHRDLPRATSGPTNGQLVRWFISLGLKQPWRCLTLVLLNIAIMIAGLAVLTITGLNLDVLHQAVDENAAGPTWRLGIEPPEDWQPLTVLIAINTIALLVAVVRALLRYATAVTQGKLVQRILSNLRSRVYDKLQRLSFRFFDANETGSIINRATSDCSALAVFVEFAMIQVLILAITLAVTVVYMLHIHPLLTLICLGSTPLLLATSIVYSRMVRPAYERNRLLYDRVVMRLSENVQGKHVVEGFSLQDQQIARFQEANDELRSQQRWIFRRASFYTVIVHMLSSVNLILVLSVGGYIVIRHPESLTIGELVIFATLLSQLSNQVATIANVANTLQQSLTAARRVREVLDAPLGVESVQKPVRLPRAKGHVRMENVSFSYRDAEPVLQDISLEVKPGQCVAILGATGSGKSTLLSLIPRFYDPTAGRITLDGHDLRQLDLSDLRRNIGLVFQESFLFSNTVAFNIAFGRSDATRQEIENAARIAAAHEFISRLPDGYDTVIGEHGSNLSGGQRQRLAIARAVLTNPAILILDDATAAIDPETEQEILEAMDNAMAGRTSFVVAHRLSALRRADFIVVMDHGRIIEAGTHDELIGSEGLYRAIARMQAVDADSQWIIQARQWYLGEADTPFINDQESP